MWAQNRRLYAVFIKRRLSQKLIAQKCIYLCFYSQTAVLGESKLYSTAEKLHNRTCQKRVLLHDESTHSNSSSWGVSYLNVLSEKKYVALEILVRMLQKRWQGLPLELDNLMAVNVLIIS